MDKTPHVMLVGKGAQQWALENGFTKASFQVPVPQVQKDYEEWRIKSEYKTGVNVENHDTIGMLALDANGRMAGACTTSGMAYKIRGRVGIVQLLVQDYLLTVMLAVPLQQELVRP